MYTSIISMIESASVITLAVVFSLIVGDRLRGRFWANNIVFGVVFGLVGLLSMSSPVEVAPGVIVDARNVVTAMSAVIGGPLSAVITALCLIAVRWTIGGAGVIPGSVTISLVAATSVILVLWWKHRGQDRYRFSAALMLSAVVTACPVATVLYFSQIFDLSTSIEALMFSIPTNFGVLLFSFLVIAEEQRRWALSAYADTQSQVRNLADNAPGVLFQLELVRENEIRFIYMSGGAQRYFRSSPDEIVANPNIVIDMLSQASRVQMEQSLHRSFDTQEAWFSEVKYRPSEGEERWLRVAAAKPRWDMKGRLIWDGSLFDITDDKRTQEMKNEFISTVSHELRTPLTSIRGSLGLISGGAAGELPAKASALVKIANSNAERLVRLINDILDIEKIESGHMPFHLKPQALFPLIKQSTDASRDYLPERKVELSLIDDAPDIRANVDADRLHQVLSNLLSNAIKHSPVNGKVSVALSRNGQRARIAVSDQGPGIPKTYRELVFEKFEQVDGSATKSVGGTGLGLSIVKAIVEKLDGEVSFETTVGVGTTFYVDLPEIVDSRTPIAGATETKIRGEGVAAETQARGKKILICEDEPDVAAVIVAMLRECDVESDVAPDIQTALARLSEGDYVAMTLDIRLAGESGIDLYQQIRMTPALKDLPIIVISAVVDEARKTLNGAALGVVDWLSKPIDIDRLRMAVTRARQGDFLRRPSVLHVEDDDDVVEIIAASLGDAVSFDFAKSVSGARKKLIDNHYDLIILDLELTDGSGVELLNEIPSDASVVIFSATEVDRDLADKVEAAMIKTKTSEIEIGTLVKALAEKRMNDRTCANEA